MMRRATAGATQLHKAKEQSSIEQLAAQARADRAQRCSDELKLTLDALSKKHNCELVVVVQIGNELRPINTVLSLPVSITAIALDVTVSPSPNGNGVHKDN